MSLLSFSPALTATDFAGRARADLDPHAGFAGRHLQPGLAVIGGAVAVGELECRPRPRIRVGAGGSAAAGWSAAGVQDEKGSATSPASIVTGMCTWRSRR